VLTTLSGLVAKSKNPDLGTYVIPSPEVALPTYIGIRFEDDQRFQKFLNRWAEWNLLTGANDARMIGSLGLLGITDIPDGLKFTP
jgi:polar amino acid transport system substrate-binding protein